MKSPSPNLRVPMIASFSPRSVVADAVDSTLVTSGKTTTLPLRSAYAAMSATVSHGTGGGEARGPWRPKRKESNGAHWTASQSAKGAHLRPRTARPLAVRGHTALTASIRSVAKRAPDQAARRRRSRCLTGPGRSARKPSGSGRLPAWSNRRRRWRRLSEAWSTARWSR